jgi:porphobilinogen synthase
MFHRNRINRKSPAIRAMLAETSLSPDDFIVPLFIVEGTNQRVPIDSMPGYFRLSLDQVKKELEELRALGLRSVLLFAKCEDAAKDNTGREALNENGLMQRSIRAIREWAPDICIMSDVALDPYSSYGHDGIVEGTEILNDATVEVLAAMSVSHARAGVDYVAPSDMMDGRVGAIRQALEAEGFHPTGILSYTAKYASCFYGPFRDALDSAPGFGDKKTYQMNPANRREALLEAEQDMQEGADIMMVKPALAYLDIIREIRDIANIPIAAYQVSGEYAMIKAAAEKGWVREETAMLETLTSIKRAGADLIASYFAKDCAKILNA